MISRRAAVAGLLAGKIYRKTARGNVLLVNGTVRPYFEARTNTLRLRLLLSFSDYTDADRPYMYHCHILEHEDAGMMGQFVVTA